MILILSLSISLPAPARLKEKRGRFAFTLKFRTCSVYREANPAKLSTKPLFIKTLQHEVSDPKAPAEVKLYPVTPSRVLPLVYVLTSRGLS